MWSVAQVTAAAYSRVVTVTRNHRGYLLQTPTTELPGTFGCGRGEQVDSVLRRELLK
jgi:hypothetical protein